MVDTSAVAIAIGEPGDETLEEAVSASRASRMAAPTYAELCAVMYRRGRPEILCLVDRLLDAYGIEVDVFDAEQEPGWAD